MRTSGSPPPRGRRHYVGTWDRLPSRAGLVHCTGNGCLRVESGSRYRKRTAKDRHYPHD